MARVYSISYEPLCPYYKGEKRNEIFCEGLYPTGTTVNTFPGKDIREDYMDKYCNCNWEACLLSKALSTKYTSYEELK